MRRSGLIHSQDTMANKQDYVDLGLSCVDICKALERGMGEKKLNELSKSVCDAINQLTTWVEPVTRPSVLPLTMILTAGPSQRYKRR